MNSVVIVIKMNSRVSLFICLLYIMGVQIVHPGNVRYNHSQLDQSLQAALEAHRHGERTKMENDDYSRSDNKNQGLINTIVNHNDKIRNIENKFNYIVNNFANSSHIKEVVEKTKVLENHVFGLPRPHSSWREFLLMVIIVGGVGVITIKVVKKYIGPKFTTYIQKHSINNKATISSISERIELGSLGCTVPTNNLKMSIEQQLEEHSKILNIISQKLKDDNRGGGREPVDMRQSQSYAREERN